MRQSTVLVLASLLAACQPSGPEEGSLTGEWLGINYQCPIGVLHEESVSIVEKDGTIVAKKVTGDDCVPAGEVTFTGTRDSIQCITGVPGEEGFSSYSGRILVERGDQFSACGVTFVRVDKPDA